MIRGISLCTTARSRGVYSIIRSHNKLSSGSLLGKDNEPSRINKKSIKKHRNSFTAYASKLKWRRQSDEYFENISKKCGSNIELWQSHLNRKAFEGMPDSVKRLLDMMDQDENIFVTIDHRNYYLEACIHGKNSVKALDYFLHLNPSDRNRETFKKLILACAVSGDHATIRKIMAMMKHKKMEFFHGHWDALINAVCKIK